MAIKIVSVEQMREIDRKTIQERGVAGLDLMERAGRAVADEILEHYSPRKAGIVTGKGNNAGDGLVVARLLKEAGVQVVVMMLIQGESLSEACKANFERLPEGVEIVGDDRVKSMPEVFEECDVLVDAILGTGLTGPIRGAFGEAVAAMNDLDIAVVAVDVPSGLNGDTGEAEGACILAERTVTIGLPKRGLVLGHGETYAGEVFVADIGFPEDLVDSDVLTEHVLDLEDAIQALPIRPPDGNKGTFGSLLAICGSRPYCGAAFLTVSAALRSGCGMVYAAMSEGVMDLLASRLIEAVKVTLPGEGADGHLTRESWDALEPCFENTDAIAVGPGLGTDEETALLVEELVCVNRPMVIDADALNCLGEKALYLTERKAATVLTPHPGEMGRILGISAAEVQADRLGAALRVAREAEVVVVLKGWRTVVAAPDGRVFINQTGGNGLAKGGSGDVLTGLIGGFLAQGCGGLGAACAGVLLHGVAGDMAAAEFGVRGMTARDVLRQLPEALKMCE